MATGSEPVAPLRQTRPAAGHRLRRSSATALWLWQCLGPGRNSPPGPATTSARTTGRSHPPEALKTVRSGPIIRSRATISTGTERRSCSPCSTRTNWYSEGSLLQAHSPDPKLMLPQQSEISATRGCLKNERTSAGRCVSAASCTVMRSAGRSSFCSGWRAWPVRLAWLQSNSSGLRSGA